MMVKTGFLVFIIIKAPVVVFNSLPRLFELEFEWKIMNKWLGGASRRLVASNQLLSLKSHDAATNVSVVAILIKLKLLQKYNGATATEETAANCLYELKFFIECCERKTKH